MNGTMRLVLTHELRRQLASYRFQILTGVVVISFLIASLGFRLPAEERATVTAGDESAVPLFALIQEINDYQAEPLQLGFFASGRVKYLPDRYSYGSFRQRHIELEQSVEENIFFPTFPDLDWSFLIASVMTFLSLALTFDSISGDRQAGVLRLVLSFGVARRTLLIAKYLATMILLLLPLALSLSFSLLILQWKGLVLTASDWAALGLMAALSLVYLSFWVLLGLAFSARVRRAETAFVLLIFCFALATQVVPGAARSLARYLRPVESNSQVQAAVDSLWEDLFSQRRDPGTDLRLRRQIDRRLEQYRNEKLLQAGLAQMLGSVSPSHLYFSICLNLAGGGLFRIEDTLSGIRRHLQLLDETVLELDRKDPESRHAGLVHYRTLSNKPVARNSLPRFKKEPSRVRDRLAAASVKVLVLLVLNGLVWTIALVFFEDYDVR